MNGIPVKQGLYDPRFEHDGCGVGFVADIKGRKSNAIIRQGLEVLKRLAHRGATGADPKTGDGAGVLLQLPHKFFCRVAEKSGISLPREGAYASGLVFLPKDAAERDYCKGLFLAKAAGAGMRLLGWRAVPVDSSVIGETARSSQPVIEQVFVAAAKAGGRDNLGFEQELFLLRKEVENALRKPGLMYIANLSCRSFSYKGLLMPQQLDKFFLDLQDAELESALCLAHSRYSTNTFPAWDLAQPFRFLAHNGEINTLRGNINWMRAREGLLENSAFGRRLKRALPVIAPGGSDSAALDNIFELLALSGRDLAQAMMLLIPAAWEADTGLSEEVRDFYRYHSCLMEPWDGPAAVAFTDGVKVAAVLDRNGLRPARYLISKTGLAVMASEAGVLDLPAADILASGRLEPGKMFFIDTQEGRIVEDAEIKERIARRQPYGLWLRKNLVELDKLPAYSVGRMADRKNYTLNASRNTGKRYPPGCLLTQLKAFGYTREDLKYIIKPMAQNGQEPVGSMGNDTPPAVLSARPQPLFNYFKQLFAQVTNPAIDPIREGLVMSLQTALGPEKNLLEETPGHCRRLLVKYPLLCDGELEKIRCLEEKGFRAKTISLLFPAREPGGFARRLQQVCSQAGQAVRAGYSFIILSDRGVNQDYAGLPSLLACSAVHQYLLRKALRTQISIILETAEPREVHHFALLFGFGADCVNPYLAFAAVAALAGEGEPALAEDELLRRYLQAAHKGVLKILSKMGISTLQSYRGAQIFEALGLNAEFIAQYFTGTVSRVGGAGLEVIAQEALLRHKQAFGGENAAAPLLPTGGIYQWKRDGEFHLWNPESISALQQAARNNDPAAYEKFSAFINNQQESPVTLRSLLKFKAGTKPVALEEVEPAEEIFKRFASGAMSFGSLSRACHETIAIAMNRLGARSNSGEGGEDPRRFLPLANGDSRRSRVKQVASGRFGVTTNYLINADELQIKIAQGAKPGEGGQLPGHKVSEIIARTRYTTPGVTLISPPPHHDIYSIEDLAQLIFDLKSVNPRARVSVKLVSEAGVGTVAAGVAKGHADMILISGADGGTGASPLSSIMHAGLPWELGLAETHQTLVLNNLRARVRLQADGQLRTGRDVAIAALLGAQEFGFASAVLITLGCVMLRHCHLNNCSLGVATQDQELEKRFSGRPEYIENYFRFVAQELRRIMAALGFRRLEEMVGRSDLLELNREILPWKARQIDFSAILYQPAGSNAPQQPGAREKVLDQQLISLVKPALEQRQPVEVSVQISNTDRATGALLSGEVCRIFGEAGLPDDTLRCCFRGQAGQSFAAWLAKGVTFELEGLANDYVGKGISGGKVIIYPYRKAGYPAQDNVIIGNTAFYGAITGEAYIRGAAGERFCIRNSGLSAVVEAVGDHGCEYMTGGRVAVLGKTGRNFAAGMSGGIAYVYNPLGDFPQKCNLEMVELEQLGAEDRQALKALLQNHCRYTASVVARRMLDNFAVEAGNFLKVMPREYKRILEQRGAAEIAELLEVSDG